MIETKKFPDGETYLKIPCDIDEDVVLFQNGFPDANDRIVEIMLAANALERQGLKINTLILPYFPYARQDKIFLDGEALSVEAICNMLVHLGIKRLLTINAHFMKGNEFMDIGGMKIENINAVPLLLKGCKDVVIVPDEGMAAMVEGIDNVVIFHKKRKEYADNEKTAYRCIGEMFVKSGKILPGAHVLIIDDMISSGGTMIKAVELAKRCGAKKISVSCIHGLFLSGAELKLYEAGAEEISATDTIETALSEISVAGVIAERLR